MKVTKLTTFLTLLCLLMKAGLSFAQSGNLVSGIIINEKTGELIQGVSVQQKGTNNGTTSGANGQYAITAPMGAVLVFSFTGFEQKELTVSNNSLDVALQEAASNLEEVTVVGYGQQKSKSITSSIAKMKAEDLDQRPLGRIDQAMAGKLAGVQIQELSGAPGRPMGVKVRGTNSITSSSAPLYVIDGFPVSSGLDNINPGDIESIEVLKDAASAAIYGSRGSNGVVLVTTRSGKSGKPSVQLDSYYGIQDRFSKVDVLNRDEYIAFAIEERNNTWELQGGNASDPNSARSNANYWIDPLWLTNPTSFPDRDWQDIIARKAPVYNVQLSASGSNEHVKYFVSANYFNQQGIIIGSDFKRLSFRANVETKVGKRLNLGLNLSAGSAMRNDSDGDGFQGPVSRSTRVAPIVGLDQQTQDGGYYQYHAAFYLNPLALATELTNKSNNRSLLANVYATVQLAKNLQFRSSFGADNTNGFSEYFKPNNINRGVGHIGTFGASYRENYLNENILTYNLDKKRLNVNALGGFTYQEEKFTQGSLAKAGFPDDEVTTLNAGTILSTGSSDATAWTLMSFLSRVNASWDDKYFVSASVRRDGSSRFGTDNRWGWFPAFSAGWLISSERFMESVDFLSNLKLRVSYGSAGNNNIGNYAAIGQMTGTNYVTGAAQNVIPGYAPASFSNRMLGWEKTNTFDLGADVSFLNNRIGVSLDFYRSDVKDLLLNVQIPAISGFTTAVRNIGAIRNTGVELELNTVNLTGKLKWNSSFNISHNRNKVTALGAGGAPIYNSQEGFIVTITKIGEPIGSYYLFQQEGVFLDQRDLDTHPHYRVQNVGDIKYKDVDGNGVIDDNDKVIAGNNAPKYFWGMHHTFAYGNFDLAVSSDGQWGNKLLNIALSQTGQSRGNVDGFWRERWKSPSEPGNGWVPRAAVTANLTTPSTFWLRNASFFRVRTIALGYRVPDSVLKGINAFNGVRIYASVDNVFMYDHYNKNPQTGTRVNSNTIPGIDYDSTYPLARTFTFGVNVKF